MARTGLAWFSAKCIFRHPTARAEPVSSVYEERVIVTRARDFQAAMAKAEEEEEARECCALLDAEYLDHVSVFSIDATELGDKAEVYSLMRTSPLASDEYLDTFYDTGAEHERKS